MCCAAARRVVSVIAAASLPVAFASVLTAFARHRDSFDDVGGLVASPSLKQLAATALELKRRPTDALDAYQAGFTQSKWHRRGKDEQISDFCVQDKVLPQLFLLGAQKCATTSLALDLMQAGVSVYNVSTGGDKEAHFFDKWPEMVFSDMTISNQRGEWMSNMPPCPADGSAAPVLADFTPSNLRSVPLPAGTRPTGSHWGLWFLHHSDTDLLSPGGREMDLPRTLRHFYTNVAAKKLVFVVMLREPLSRMQSAWYHAAQPYSHWKQCRDCKGETFAKALNASLQRSMAATPFYDDWLWTSMYGRHMAHWLSHFSPDQFYVIPYKQYTNGNKSSICKGIAARLSPGVKCADLDAKEAALSNSHEHPGLQDDCPPELRKSFHFRMKPEKQLLLQVLAQASDDGAALANYNDAPGSLPAIHVWLKTWW